MNVETLSHSWELTAIEFFLNIYNKLLRGDHIIVFIIWKDMIRLHKYTFINKSLNIILISTKSYQRDKRQEC